MYRHVPRAESLVWLLVIALLYAVPWYSRRREAISNAARERDRLQTYRQEHERHRA